MRSLREPEADRVDTALASAAVAFATVVADERLVDLKPQVMAIIRGALALLEADGYSREESARVLKRRMSRTMRPVIDDFIALGSFRRRLKQSAK